VLQIDGVLTVDLAELRSTHEETLPKLFN
jgi:hypothetical protein